MKGKVNIDDLFYEGLSRCEEAMPTSAWRNMESLLDGKNPYEDDDKKRRPFAWFFSLLVTALVVGVGSYFWLKPSSNKAQQTNSSSTQQNNFVYEASKNNDAPENMRYPSAAAPELLNNQTDNDAIPQQTSNSVSNNLAEPRLTNNTTVYTNNSNSNTTTRNSSSYGSSTNSSSVNTQKSVTDAAQSQSSNNYPLTNNVSTDFAQTANSVDTDIMHATTKRTQNTPKLVKSKRVKNGQQYADNTRMVSPESTAAVSPNVSNSSSSGSNTSAAAKSPKANSDADDVARNQSSSTNPQIQAKVSGTLPTLPSGSTLIISGKNVTGPDGSQQILNDTLGIVTRKSTSTKTDAAVTSDIIEANNTETSTVSTDANNTASTTVTSFGKKARRVKSKKAQDGLAPQQVSNASQTTPSTSNTAVTSSKESTTTTTSSTTTTNTSVTPSSGNKPRSSADAAVRRNLMNAVQEGMRNGFIRLGTMRINVDPSVLAGINMQLLSNKSDLGGFHGGMSFAVELSKRLSFVPHIMYYYKNNGGFNVSDTTYTYTNLAGPINNGNFSYFTYDKTSTITTHNFKRASSIEMPLVMQYSLNPSINVFGGANLAYGFRYNTRDFNKISTSKGMDSTVIGVNYQFPTNTSSFYKSPDFNGRFGVGYVAGLQWQATQNLLIDLRTSQNVWDNTTTPGGKIVSKNVFRVPSIQLSLGYKIVDEYK